MEKYELVSLPCPINCHTPLIEVRTNNCFCALRWLGNILKKKCLSFALKNTCKNTCVVTTVCMTVDKGNGKQADQS